LGFLVSRETKAVFESFSPDHASLLLAYQSSPVSNHTYFSAKAYKYVHDPIAGILLLMYKKTAYYWFASSLGIGKKLFAPTLLVWEALRLAQKKGCTHFDFEGIYDERFPKAAESWRGFTKFKEGFGGEKVIYLENFKQ
jgi:lipid II:glycine glycyltransferase (peptidoglycan interpeptide bridge formation enzyme)